MKRITPALKTELWTMIHWLSELSNKKVSIVGVSSCGEMCLINTSANLMYNFDIGNVKEVRNVNKALCLWVNKGIKARIEFDN